MAKTVGDFLFDRLEQWGVRRIFGYPGDGINGIVTALGRAGDKIEFSAFNLDLGSQAEFFERIYAATRRLAWGQTTTYGALAKELGAGPSRAAFESSSIQFGLLSAGLRKPLDDKGFHSAVGEDARGVQPAAPAPGDEHVGHVVSPTPSWEPGSWYGISHGAPSVYIDVMNETPERQADP